MPETSIVRTPMRLFAMPMRTLLRGRPCFLKKCFQRVAQRFDVANLTADDEAGRQGFARHLEEPCGPRSPRGTQP